MTTPTPRPLRVLISGGGTGGHIFPALAIADALKALNPETEIQFVGALGRMEMERVPAAGYPIEGLPVMGFDRRRLWRNAKVLLHLWRSMRKARRIVRTCRPDIAIGVGGYASGPTLKAAQRAGVPSLLQEQNSYAGVTNKLLATKARRICTAYEGMERFFPADKIVLTGNPIRQMLKADDAKTPAQAKEDIGFDPQEPLLVVIGGSLGARSINKAMAEQYQAILNAGINIVWQTGKLYYDQYKSLQTPAVAAHLHIQPFITNMAEAYRGADLVVARAGAGTISELQMLGVPSILVPSPNVAEDHQTKNAQALASRQAAMLLPDADLAQLSGAVIKLMNDAPQRQRMAVNVKAMELPNAAEKIAQEAYGIVYGL